MVVNNLPTAGKSLEDQGEHTARFARLPRKVPSSKHKSRVFSERTHLHFRKFQVAHRFRVRIILPVTRQHGLIATGNPAAPRETHLRRIPVTLHKFVHVPAIPRSLLLGQNRQDWRARGIFHSRHSSRVPVARQENQRHTCHRQSA